jgi:hypothetical protein
VRKFFCSAPACCRQGSKKLKRASIFRKSIF